MPKTLVRTGPPASGMRWVAVQRGDGDPPETSARACSETLVRPAVDEPTERFDSIACLDDRVRHAGRSVRPAGLRRSIQIERSDRTPLRQRATTSVSQYAGQQLLTGPQAEAFADHFIAIHLSEMPYEGVYAKISAAARAEPTNTKLAALETTSFQGTTLRGLLLEAYGFSKIGTIMLYGAIASFILALVMLGFVLLGFRHAQRTPIEQELLLAKKREPVPVGTPS